MEKCDGCNGRKNGRWYCEGCHDELLNEAVAERDRYKAALEEINSWGCRYGDGYPNHCAVCVANVALNSEP